MTWETISPNLDRFVDLPGYDFADHYETIDGVNVHYVDERSGP